MIQGEIKGNFILSRVENALWSRWPDDQIRKRDGETKNQIHFQDDEEDEEDMEPMDDEDEAYFEESGAKRPEQRSRKHGPKRAKQQRDHVSDAVRQDISPRIVPARTS